MMNREVVRVTDDTTRAEIEAALTNLARAALRRPHTIGTPELPTESDRASHRINTLIDEWRTRA